MDPDGRALPAAVATYWASVFVVSATVVYLATPAGLQGGIVNSSAVPKHPKCI